MIKGILIGLPCNYVKSKLKVGFIWTRKIKKTNRTTLRNNQILQNLKSQYTFCDAPGPNTNQCTDLIIFFEITIEQLFKSRTC